MILPTLPVWQKFFFKSTIVIAVSSPILGWLMGNVGMALTSAAVFWFFLVVPMTLVFRADEGARRQVVE